MEDDVNEYLKSLIRTITPMVVGTGAVILQDQFGLTESCSTEVVGVVATGVGAAYYAIVRWYEVKTGKGSRLLGTPVAPRYDQP